MTRSLLYMRDLLVVLAAAICVSVMTIALAQWALRAIDRLCDWFGLR